MVRNAHFRKTRFFESGFPERISGASDDQRMLQLRSATERTVDLIVREYERKAGKILLVVNSYVQAQEVQRTLETALRKVNCSAQVCRMISDAVSSENVQGTVRRGEVSRFAKMKEEILIAPAMAIERGHNIVDEYGHSALCAVFSWYDRWLCLMISSKRAASSMDLWSPTVIGLPKNLCSHTMRASANLRHSSGQR